MDLPLLQGIRAIRIPDILAVDFDGTLVEDRFPGIGRIKQNTWEKLLEWRNTHMGGKVILWTCRTGDMLREAVDFCADNGLHFDAINDNIDEVKVRYGDNARKVYANEYWDDRAVRIE